MTITASAPGKIILFGEHAVVYNRPAIAVPVAQVQATVTLEPRDRGLSIHALDTGRTLDYAQADPLDPLAGRRKQAPAPDSARSQPLFDHPVLPGSLSSVDSIS